jgi:ABC-type oligopeptide transport system substrate-binding subunit
MDTCGHGPRPEGKEGAMSAGRVRVAIAAAAAVALVLTACSSNSSDNNSSSNKPIVVGISLSSSGDFSDPSAAATSSGRTRSTRAAA